MSVIKNHKMSGLSSEMFETLEEELDSLFDVIRIKTETKLLGSPFGEGRKKLVNEIERDLSECQSLLQQLESEARSTPLPYRAELTSKIRGHRETAGKLGTRYRAVMADFGGDRR